MSLVQVFKRKSSEAQSAKSKADTHLNVASQRESAILPDKGHPGGLANRTSEKVELAGKGENWHSEACVHLFLLHVQLLTADV